MKLLTFYHEAAELTLGVRIEASVLHVPMAAALLEMAGVPTTMEEVFARGDVGLQWLKTCAEVALRERDRLAGCFLPEEGLRLGPCVPNPGKIICVGLNYRRHAAESNMEPPRTPVLFSKFNNALAAQGDTIPIPEEAVQIDYEAELALVIGRRTRNVSPDEALGHVFGYCNANDLSARDLQFRTNQWLLGKTLDGFSPIGPFLVTADEVGDPQALTIGCWVNGELRQNSSTKDMIFPCDYVVSYISRYMTLEPGDLILTGTPEGVILGKQEKHWLREGDVMTVAIGNLGALTNTIGGPARGEVDR